MPSHWSTYLKLPGFSGRPYDAKSTLSRRCPAGHDMTHSDVFSFAEQPTTVSAVFSSPSSLSAISRYVTVSLPTARGFTSWRWPIDGRCAPGVTHDACRPSAYAASTSFSAANPTVLVSASRSIETNAHFSHWLLATL